MERTIKGHPDYHITDTGEVISYKRKKPTVLKPDFSSGYLRVNVDGVRRYVADLVAEHFLNRPLNPDYKIFFIDGDTENCEVDNLVYLNSADRQRLSKYTVEYRRQILGKF